MGERCNKRSVDVFMASRLWGVSISQSNLPIVIEYVDNQAAHHRQRTFQDEFRELCQRHELDLDERYAWD